ncbi:hypothetical protein FXV91_18400 [Methanosarcina sp. DH2]|uniref:hypothetical protein n=1 Tax=Methanosarcina sp. DH2 TaxID=2605639 RepID=UPI001E45B6A8|nr:hypothetical protein [Methanosarcina sp. DH2]MCC4772060.1 hypothetical protein [Methanosarcina sp. DH2]
MQTLRRVPEKNAFAVSFWKILLPSFVTTLTRTQTPRGSYLSEACPPASLGNNRFKFTVNMPELACLAWSRRESRI